jgi:hypothetical protein
MRDVCGDEDMPNRVTVYAWLAAHTEFADQYARATEIRADALADEMFAIADDGSNDWMEREGKDGSTAWVENGEAIRRSALRIDTRKWALARMAPRKYGDRVTTELTGPNGSPLAAGFVVQVVAPDPSLGSGAGVPAGGDDS